MFEIQLHKILNVSLCWDILRQVRWSEGIRCPHCGSSKVVKNGMDDNCPDKQKYGCNGCHRKFDDLTGTIFSGSKQPLHHWITVLYLMNLNVSNSQIAKELDISEATVQGMCGKIREGVVKKSLLYHLSVTLRLTNVMSLPDKKDSPPESGSDNGNHVGES